MARLTAVLTGFALLDVLAVPALAQEEPTVAIWRNYLVVTAPAASNTPRDAATLQTLVSRKITFKFTETPFSEAVDFLAAVSNLNFVLHRNAPVGDLPVNISLRDVSLRTALNILTRQLDLEWTLRDGVVLIGHKQDLAGPMRASVHDATELLAVVPDFPGPEINLNQSSNNSRPDVWPPVTQQPAPTRNPEKSRAELMQDLAQIVQQLIGSQTWDTGTFP